MNPAQELGELFPPGPGASQPVALLQRHGHLQLALPPGRAAVPALELYPAQRPLARLFKWGVRWAASIGLPLPFAKGTLSLPDQDPFVAFLRSLASGTSGEFFLGICAGNPRAEGRRWLILVCAGSIPLAVVKAGVTPAARALINREFALEPAPGACPILARHEDPRVSAFAMPFIAGPSASEDSALAWDLGKRWLRIGETARLHALSPWPQLWAATSLTPEQRTVLERLNALEVTPAFFHGDLAPWNIRLASPNHEPVVLDWERGETRGVPLWDVLHFRVQPLVLVHRASAAEIAQAIETLLTSTAACDYAVKARIAGQERRLAWAYVLHCARMQQQTEGSALMDELLTHLTQRWNVA